MGDRRAALRALLWRRRGAWQWPAFAAALGGETALLHELPVSGYGTGLLEAFVIAGLLNVVVLAAVAPLGALALRRRRPDLPRVVARDRAGTLLIALVGGLLAGLGIAHHRAVGEHDRAFRAQSDAVRRYVTALGGSRFRARLDEADTLVLDRHVFRTCVPAADPRQRLCLFVDTSIDPPGVSVDPSSTANARYARSD